MLIVSAAASVFPRMTQWLLMAFSTNCSCRVASFHWDEYRMFADGEWQGCLVEGGSLRSESNWCLIVLGDRLHTIKPKYSPVPVSVLSAATNVSTGPDFRWATERTESRRFPGGVRPQPQINSKCWPSKLQRRRSTPRWPHLHLAWPQNASASRTELHETCVGRFIWNTGCSVFPVTMAEWQPWLLGLEFRFCHVIFETFYPFVGSRRFLILHSLNVVFLWAVGFY